MSRSWAFRCTRIASRQACGVPLRPCPMASPSATNSDGSGVTATRKGRRRASSASMKSSGGSMPILARMPRGVLLSMILQTSPAGPVPGSPKPGSRHRALQHPGQCCDSGASARHAVNCSPPAPCSPLAAVTMARRSAGRPGTDAFLVPERVGLRPARLQGLSAEARKMLTTARSSQVSAAAVQVDPVPVTLASERIGPAIGTTALPSHRPSERPTFGGLSEYPPGRPHGYSTGRQSVRGGRLPTCRFCFPGLARRQASVRNRYAVRGVALASHEGLAE